MSRSASFRPPAPRSVSPGPVSSIPHFTIDLDLAPSARWSQVVSVYAGAWKRMVEEMWKEFEELLLGEHIQLTPEEEEEAAAAEAAAAATAAAGGAGKKRKAAAKKPPKPTAAEKAAAQAAKHAEHVAFGTRLADQMTTAFRSHGLGAYAEELESVAQAADVSLAELVLLNLSYEAHGGCTTILAPTADGKVIMGRTLDWQQPLKHLTIELSFVRAGQLIYRATSFAGFLGIFTGHVSGEYAVAVNFRCADDDQDQEEEEEEGEEEGGEDKDASMSDTESTPEFSWPVGFLVRHTLESCTDYATALDRLQRCSLMSQVYFILCGRTPDQACIVTRNPESSVQPVKMLTTVGDQSNGAAASTKKTTTAAAAAMESQEQDAAAAASTRKSKHSQRTSHQAFTGAAASAAAASTAGAAASSPAAAAASAAFNASAIGASPASSIPSVVSSGYPWLVQANLDHWVTLRRFDHQESLPRTKLVHQSLKALVQQGLPVDEARMWQVMGLDPIWDEETIYATVSIPADDRFVTLIDNPHPPPKAKKGAGGKRTRRR